ncbi:hypothetical protein DDE82_001114 [Stemphylium lycopersici]|uniref:Uncharacterized protein n=1 Tax=Stemphylium lycopersici TaxID=183478 RepID=A0A364NBA7_STELY|nr:hypothetical protein TW65_87027 [Stemphylium lycopersici]RAR10723.1 hypothetical protein DDE82_001114 [Stemphylium lycopersici]RAR14599.1 hypothetical protein DDE83_001998 [Stemphylium lycopersici]
MEADMSGNSNTSQNGSTEVSRSETPLNASVQTFAPGQALQISSSSAIVTNGINGTHSHPASASANPTLQTTLRTLPTTISITTERTSPAADPTRPLFLTPILTSPITPQVWTTTILAYIRSLTFTLASTTDIYYFTAILRSPIPDFPPLFLASNITTLSLPGFHWFSGISLNRVSNPYLTLSTHLPSLSHLSFTLHSASVTTSVWGERQMVEMERADPTRARARKTLRVAAVCETYDLKALFLCTALQKVRVVYVRSETVEGFTVVGEPEGVVREVGEWVREGFRGLGRVVEVKVVREG